MEMNFSPCLFFRSGISLLRLQDIDNQTGKQIGGFVYNRNIRRLTLKLVQSLFMNLRLGRPDSFFANQTQNRTGIPGHLFQAVRQEIFFLDHGLIGNIAVILVKCNGQGGILASAERLPS